MMPLAMAHTLKNIAGPRIAAARARHKPPLTQLGLTRRANAYGARMDRAAVAKVEVGLRSLLDYELAAIARALGVPVAKLLPVPARTARGKSSTR